MIAGKLGKVQNEPLENSAINAIESFWDIIMHNQNGKLIGVLSLKGTDDMQIMPIFSMSGFFEKELNDRMKVVALKHIQELINQVLGNFQKRVDAEEKE